MYVLEYNSLGNYFRLFFFFSFFQFEPVPFTIQHDTPIQHSSTASMCMFTVKYIYIIFYDKVDCLKYYIIYLVLCAKIVHPKYWKPILVYHCFKHCSKLLTAAAAAAPGPQGSTLVLGTKWLYALLADMSSHVVSRILN